MEATKGQLLYAHYILVAIALLLIFGVRSSDLKWITVVFFAVADTIICGILMNKYGNNWFDNLHDKVTIF
jgi:hypothetical protein